MTIVKNIIFKGAICAFTFACAAVIAAPAAQAQYESPDPSAILDNFRQGADVKRMEGAVSIGGNGGGSLGGRPIYNEPTPVAPPLISPPDNVVTPPKSQPPRDGIGRPINRPMPVERIIPRGEADNGNTPTKGGVRMSKPIYETLPVEPEPIMQTQSNNRQSGVETAVERKRQIMQEALSLPPSERPDMRKLRKELQAEERAAQETAVQKFARQEAALDDYFDEQRQALLTKQREELNALNQEFDRARAALKKEQRAERSCRMANLGNQQGVAGCDKAALPTDIMSRARVQPTHQQSPNNRRSNQDVRIGGGRGGSVSGGGGGGLTQHNRFLNHN